MNKEFITYEQALALKELGFDEPTLYHIDNHVWSAPTFSQAFRWFREKYKLYSYIKNYYDEKFFFYIEDMIHPRRYEEYSIDSFRGYNESFSYEEAEQACLNKLIEIVKQSANKSYDNRRTIKNTSNNG